MCPDNESADAFRRNAKAVAEEFPDKTILLLGCGDSYVQLAAHCKDQLPANVVAPYIDGALLDTLINKEKLHRRGPAGHPHQQGEVLSAVRPVRGGPPGHLHL